MVYSSTYLAMNRLAVAIVCFGIIYVWVDYCSTHPRITFFVSSLFLQCFLTITGIEINHLGIMHSTFNKLLNDKLDGNYFGVSRGRC